LIKDGGIVMYSSITVVVDNRARGDFSPIWGLSLLLEGDKKVLFDAGPRGDILLHNLELCDVKPEDIDIFFLSHSHTDHAGGLRGLIDAGFDGELVLPTGYSSQPAAEALPEEGLFTLEYGLAAIRLHYKHLYEQSLLAPTISGNLLLVGCAHTGLKSIWEVAAAAGAPIGAVGGFHASPAFPELKRAAVLGPCHCSSHREAFKREFPQAFRDLAAGDRLILGEDT
jgi:7,8-dihydropterin-6-yl-methyl-4-(beta-D-ribofuranosyl)aminobenzene 5'-phosphate synthase